MKHDAAPVQFEKLFEIAPFAMLVADTKGEIIQYNRKAIEYFEYTDNEFMGLSVHSLVAPKYQENHRTFVDFYYKNPEIKVMGHRRDLWGVKKNGDEFAVEISLSPIYNEELFGVLVVMVDITVRKAHEEELLALNTKISQTNTHLRQLAKELEP